MSAIPLEQEVEYPTTDGHLRAESLEHQQVMIDFIVGVKIRFADRSDVWVAGNFFLCYRRGNPLAYVSPDVMVAMGVAKRVRRNYLLWEEEPPSLVLEITSLSTRQEDQGKKKAVYERIGVEEYVLFDPFDEYLRPRLQGFHLTPSGRFQPMPMEEDGALLSRTLGLRLRPEGERLRLVDAVTGLLIPLSDEPEAKARWAAEAKAAEEAAARQAAEERVRTLEAELARLRKSS
jgi:Uma2 family endonuclease